MKCWRNFTMGAPPCDGDSPKFRHTGCLIQQPRHFSFFLKDMVCVISLKVHAKLFLPKGRNTSKYTEWVNTHDQRLHAYQRLQWGFRRGKGGRSSQASRYLLSGWSTAPFLLVCATVIYLMPTIFLCNEQFCCYICVYNFNPSLVVAPGLWINYKNQTLCFPFATRPPYILFAPPMFMPPLSDNSLYLCLWWSVASSGKHDHPSTPHLLFM